MGKLKKKTQRKEQLRCEQAKGSEKGILSLSLAVSLDPHCLHGTLTFDICLFLRFMKAPQGSETRTEKSQTRR